MLDVSRQDAQDVGMFKHEVVRRIVECRCGMKMHPSKFEFHFRDEVRKTAREVVRRALVSAAHEHDCYTAAEDQAASPRTDL